MTDILKRYNLDRKVAQEAIIYLVIGGSAVLLDAVGFLILYNLLDIDAVVSTIISITLATLFSFFLNSKYNFKKSDLVARRLVLFSGVSLLGMGISAVFIYVLSEKIGMNANLSKVLSLPLIALVQFFLNKRITFR